MISDIKINLINNQEIILAANYQTLKVLKRRGIDCNLWEDTFDKVKQLDLYRKFKLFSNQWYYDKKGNDCSIYDGVSFGSAISIYLAYDLETWIRVLYLFENWVTKRINVTFYVLNKNYFPSEIYKFVEILNNNHNYKINIISLDLNDIGIEPSVKQLLSEYRCLNKLVKTSNVTSLSLINNLKNLFYSSRKEMKRCLILHIRNTNEYLQSIFKDANDLRVFFDSHYFAPRRYFLTDLLYNKISFINDEVYFNKTSSDNYIKKLLKNGKTNLNNVSFIGNEGKSFFKNIFSNYLKGVLKEQIYRYNYLDKIIRTNKINTTLCDGPDLPETYYCKHLMDKYNGISFYIPHGLMGRKDGELDKFRQSIAHNYFFHNQLEKEIMSKTYGISNERFYPVNFLEENNNQPKNSPKISETRILILQDNFQVSLISKINYHKNFIDLCNLLRNLSFTDLSLRLCGDFESYYHASNLLEEDREKFFLSLPVHKRSDVSLTEIINDYDIIIGPLSSCILEAMWAKVFFIPFIPDYSPGKNLSEIITNQWFPGLYPKPCQNIFEIKKILLSYKKSPQSEYDKYIKSIDNVGNCKDPSSRIWQNISGKSN